jgi:methionyl-tRNA formyltransferase
MVRRLRLGFFGTPAFAVPSLEALASSRHEVAAVITQPDRPRGRGQHVTPEAVKVKATELGLPVLQPERLGDEAFVRALEGLQLDLAVVVAYGRILTPRVLAAPAGGFINVHASLLPRWRGAAPVERALLAGDTETGVTIHQTVKELDAGPVAAQRAFPLAAQDDAGTVFARAAELAVELLDEVLPAPVFRPQEGEPTYAAKIEAADRELDLSRPGESFDRIRALSPHIGARGELHGRRVTIWRARLEDGELVPVVVQPEGGRRMGYDEWLRGLR